MFCKTLESCLFGRLSIALVLEGFHNILSEFLRSLRLAKESQKKLCKFILKY